MYPLLQEPPHVKFNAEVHTTVLAARSPSPSVVVHKHKRLVSVSRVVTTSNKPRPRTRPIANRTARRSNLDYPFSTRSPHYAALEISVLLARGGEMIKFHRHVFPGLDELLATMRRVTRASAARASTRLSRTRRR